MSISHIRARAWNAWKLRQLAGREFASVELSRRSGLRHRQRGFILNQYLGGPVTDPYYSSVSALLHGDGGNDTTGISNNAPAALAFTATGNAKLKTATKKYGSASINIDSSTASPNNYVYAADATEFDLPGDMTGECWCYWDTTVYTSNFCPAFMGKRGSTTQLSYEWAYFNGSLYYGYSTDGTNMTFRTVSWTPSANGWYFLEFDRSGSNGYFFVDGAQQGSTQTVSGSLYNGTSQFKVFVDGANDTRFKGFIDDFRLTKGVARNTSNYSAPSDAFPNS